MRMSLAPRAPLTPTLSPQAGRGRIDADGRVPAPSPRNGEWVGVRGIA